VNSIGNGIRYSNPPHTLKFQGICKSALAHGGLIKLKAFMATSKLGLVLESVHKSGTLLQWRRIYDASIISTSND
jgi:hypothetical protein